MFFWVFPLVVGLLVFVPLSLTRAVDSDEGFYVYAAELVWQGRLPYVDFLYPQMPLLPYVLGTWIRVFGPTWEAARIASAVAAALAGLGVFVYIRQRTGSLGAAGAGLVLYAGSVRVLSWATTVETYPYTMALSVWSVVLLDRWYAERSGVRLVTLAGVLAGAAVAIRLLYAPVLVVSVAYVIGNLARRDRTENARAGLMFGAGVLVALLIPMAFLVASRDAFVFNNLGFHSLRSEGGLVGTLPQKLRILREFVTLPQEPVLVALAVASIPRYRIHAGWVEVRRASLPLVTAAVLGGTSLLPSPTYVSYLVTALPLCVMATAPLLERVPLLLVSKRLPILAGLIAYAAVGLLGATYTGCSHEYCLSTIESVRDQITLRTSPSGVVIASWPGYVYGAGRSLFPGMENHGRVEVIDRLTDEQAHALHVATDADALRALRSRTDAVGVFGIWSEMAPGGSIAGWIERAAPCAEPSWWAGTTVLLEHVSPGGDGC